MRNPFAADAVYSECYGPEQHGLSQLLRWFADRNQKGTVLEWTIRRTFVQGRTRIAEWYFQCDCEGTVDGFDGITVADFDENGKIAHLCEFQSNPNIIFLMMMMRRTEQTHTKTESQSHLTFRFFTSCRMRPGCKICGTI